MAKAFNDRERDLIKQKLIANCNKCWTKYGYKKTSISQICDMTGISTGAFYIFYKSKEYLFLDTAIEFQNNLVNMALTNLSKETTKESFIKVFKNICKELVKTPWLIDFDTVEYELFLRKLPEDDIQKLYELDRQDIIKIFQKVNLKFKLSETEFAALVRLLSFSIIYRDKIGNEFEKVFDIVVSATLENLIE